MIKKIDRTVIRRQRQKRVRGKISGTAERPRMNIFRSSKHIYVQVIDDIAGVTLASCSTMDKEIVSKIADKTKKDASKLVGEVIGKRCLDKGITNVVFDRGGFIYTGRVQEVAEGARAAGLQF